MDYQCKKLICTQFEQLSYEEKNLQKIIYKLIDISEEVYIFRSYNHILEKNDFIKWIDTLDTEKIKSLIIDFKKFNKVDTIEASNNELIYRVVFNDRIKKDFKENFKISIRDVKGLIKKRLLKEELFIDDPLYDQYDFIFTKRNEVMGWTDIHPFLFFIDKENIK